MPKELPILIHPDPGLRKKSRPVTDEELKSPAIQELIADLGETMRRKDGAGLAAPQVDKHLRIIVVGDEEKTLTLVNPQITKRSWVREIEEEGCLSVLNDQGEIIYAPVERYKKVNCVYLDARGNKQKISAAKMLARVIQHEIDHLDGILFIDKIAPRPKKPAKK
ncbi:MAG: peptide deformylase [Patescibacteria group bacterium]